VNDREGEANEPLEVTLRGLQESRVRLLRKLRSGDGRKAAKIGRDAVKDARRKVTVIKPHVHQLVVPSRELTSIIKVDVEVAEAITAGDLDSVVAGITRTYRLANRSPRSASPLITKVITDSGLSMSVLKYLNAPVSAARTAIGPAGEPLAQLFTEYVGQGPLALRACRHGNPTISGHCHKPPCPDAP
jgi:hypothetical protein